MKTVRQSGFKYKRLAPFFIVLMLLASGGVYLKLDHHEVVSEFGKYQGFSEAVYDGTRRTSDYLTLSDGTRLAYDLIIPTKKGILANQPLPVVFSYTPYGRTWTIFDENNHFLVGDLVDLPTKMMAHIRYWILGDQGRMMDPLFKDPWLGSVVKHGYIIVSVDRPGTGASFSSPTPGSMETASKFLNEIIDWIVAQPWSDGNVGMYGESQLAMVQFAAAAAGNPHLKAILPAASDIEIYQSVTYPGGVFNKAFNAVYALVPFLDKVATPVDSDPEGVLLEQARESREKTTSIQTANEIAAKHPYRDSVTQQGINYYHLMDLSPFIDRINHSSTAIYMTVGWYDLFTADMVYWYNNLSVPRRLTVRPTDHGQVSAKRADLDYGVEALRWLDYWLKGIENGILDEPSIHYYVQDGPKRGTWLTSDQWPLAKQNVTPYYFSPEKSGTIDSVNDGGLGTRPPVGAVTPDAYTVDYSTTTGMKSRWGAVETVHQYPDLRVHDSKALTYTTPPLVSGLEVTGHPVIHLWLTTAAPDLDVFAYLEEIDRNGRSIYITEGILRASHRKLGQAPFHILGLPYQTHFKTDQEAIPTDTPIELVFALLPTSYQFHAGNHIRITVAFADAGNFDTPILDPAPVVHLLHDGDHPSFVELPVIGDPAR